MTEVKICGITCEKEIQYLNILKPKYCGFVFTESKRKVTAAKAECLCSILDDGINPVGVFRNNSIEEIMHICDKVKLYAVQLHGNEDFEFISELRKRLNLEIKIWKALSIKEKDNIIKFMEKKQIFIDKYLIDGNNPGSGEDYKLDVLKNIVENYNLKNKFILAGGITPENVCEKIQEVSPEIVDVSSGVEIIEDNKSIKSFEKIKKLLGEIV